MSENQKYHLGTDYTGKASYKSEEYDCGIDYTSKLVDTTEFSTVFKNHRYTHLSIRLVTDEGGVLATISKQRYSSVSCGMATAQQSQPVHVCYRDAVKDDGVLKEQVNTEEEAKCSWDRKWHFMRDFYKTYLTEAAKQGLNEQEFLKLRTTKIRPKDMEVDGWVAQASLGKFPLTSSAMVGWRSSRIECSMERFGPLYISPRHTVTEPDRPSSPAQQTILLG